MRRQPEVEKPPLAQYFLLGKPSASACCWGQEQARKASQNQETNQWERGCKTFFRIKYVLIWSNTETHFLKLKPFGYFIVFIFLENKKISELSLLNLSCSVQIQQKIYVNSLFSLGVSFGFAFY